MSWLKLLLAPVVGGAGKWVARKLFGAPALEAEEEKTDPEAARHGAAAGAAAHRAGKRAGKP